MLAHDLLAAAALEWRKQQERLDAGKRVQEQLEREKAEALRRAENEKRDKELALLRLSSETSKAEQEKREKEAALLEAGREKKRALDQSEFLRLEAQNEAEADKRRSLIRAFATVMGMLLVAIASLIFAVIQKRGAVRLADLASSGQLSAQAELWLRDHPTELEPAAVMAIQSVDLGRSFENDF